MQILLSGLVSGVVISLLAIAFQVVYLPTKIFYIALAGIYSLAPFIVYSMHALGLSWLFSVMMSLIICIAVSVFCEIFNHKPLMIRKASEKAHLITSLGIYIVLIQIISLVWGNDPKSFQTSLQTTYNINELTITHAQFLTLFCSLFIVYVFILFLTKTQLGLRLRALADNTIEFALLGYNVDWHRMLSFAISGFLAAASSLLIAFDVGFDPNLGLEALLVSVVAVIVGGTNSFWGPAIAGILLGILRAEVVWYLSAQWQDAITFLFLILFLFFKPQGLFGKKQRIESLI